jgi:hypothetical protein
VLHSYLDLLCSGALLQPLAGDVVTQLALIPLARRLALVLLARRLALQFFTTVLKLEDRRHPASMTASL